MKMNRTFTLIIGFLLLSSHSFCQQLQINDSGYFEKRGLNVFVFSNQYNGMFFDEKTAGIEIIHHGVRTSTGGAVRLQNTPEQWDLIPDFPENKEDWPFFWGENEVTVGGCADYILLAAAAGDLIKK